MYFFTTPRNGGETNFSHVFYKKYHLKIYAKFTGNHLYRSVVVNKVTYILQEIPA